MTQPKLTYDQTLAKLRDLRPTLEVCREVRDIHYADHPYNEDALRHYMTHEAPVQPKENPMSLTSSLYRAARVSASGRAVRTGNTGRRAKNLLVGRALGRLGFWGRLWR